MSLVAAVASNAVTPKSVARALLDHEDWRAFAATYWESRPLVVEHLEASGLPLDAASLFSAMCTLVTSCPVERRDRWMQLYVDGVRRPLEDELLPSTEDGSLEGYDTRITRVLGGREYLVRMEKLHVFYAPYWEGAYRFLGTLFDHVGVAPGADTAVFMGRYQRTPSGVHYDNLSSFNFPIVGRKGLRVWPRAYVTRNPTLVGSTAYESHLAGSQLLEAEPGGMFYWPSSAFHIGEGSGAFSATLGIGVWIDKQPLGMVLEMLGHLVRDADASAAATVRTYAVEPAATVALPPPLAAAIDQIEQLAREGTLRRSITNHWLETLTSHSLKRAPEGPARDGATYAIAVGHPLRIAPDGDTLLVAARGRVASIPSRCRELVVALNAGPVDIDRWAHHHALPEAVAVAHTLRVAGLVD